MVGPNAINGRQRRFITPNLRGVPNSRPILPVSSQGMECPKTVSEQWTFALTPVVPSGSPAISIRRLTTRGDLQPVIPAQTGRV